MRRKAAIGLVALLGLLVAFNCFVFAQSKGGEKEQGATVVLTESDGGVLLSAPSYKEKVTQKLDRLVTGDMFITSQLGLMVYDLDAESTIYAFGERQLLRPASTMKLLTAITALDLLGKNYRYRTAVYASGETSPTTLYGNIYVKGMMDPTLEETDIDRLVEGITALKIDTIQGEIVADRSFMDSPPLGKGWCWDDDNPALTPLVYQRKDNLTDVLRQKLRDLGIVITGRNTTGTTPKDATLLAERYTLLETVLMKMLKDSDNLYAESVLYNISGAKQLPATATVAQEQEQALLRKIGLNPEDYSLADGSGLSLYNYLSAECEVYLLRYAYHDFYIFNTLRQSLPEAGVDGTLKRRMQKTPAESNVRAKTGTLSGVSTLAGYCTSPEGHTLAFAIFNQGIMHGQQARAFQDEVCEVLCEEDLD